MTARPYMSVSVQIDTPDAPALDNRVVRTVSWIATRQDSGRVHYTIYAHRRYVADGESPLATVLSAESIDPALVPDWVPWPPANWLASLELGKPDPDHKIRAYLAQEGSCRTVEVTGGIIPDPHTLFAGGVW